MGQAQRIDPLAVIQNGLPPAQGKPKRVIVVGAGMAGLTAAYELLSAGHDPLVLEGRTRIGGRIHTLREPFTAGLYAEAGAMRIPRTHELTMAFVKKFGLATLPFTMGNPNAFCYIEGKKHRLTEVNADPSCLGFEVNERERGKTPAQLWQQTLQPFEDKIKAGGESAWDEIVAQYDRYSTREYLEEQNWSEGAIEMYGLLANQEARMNMSFVELLRQEVGHDFENMVTLDGGMDNLPRAFLPTLGGRIRFGARMVALDQAPGSVTVHYETLAGRTSVKGDYCIISVPFSVMRHVEVLKPFSHGKQRAIRELHYDASAKVFIQCRKRFWEEEEGIFGGGTVTDLAIRNLYYPEKGREMGRGVLLASYTWAEDAQRWGSLEPEERITQAMEDVARIHPQIKDVIEGGASKMWHDDEFAGGAFCLFEPEQQTMLYQDMLAPEGRIHFAGEHTSLTHRWIQGAIESGIRAAVEVHARPEPSAA